MALSKLKIINAGLLQVGAAKLSSLDDDTKSARLASDMYELVLLEIFDMDVDWKFAITRKELVALSVDPVFGTYDHQYVMPAGCRRLLAMCDEDGDTVEYAYSREVYVDSSNNQTDVILTSQDEVFIKFIILRTNEAAYPGWFAKLISDKISMMLAEPMKQRTEIYNKLRFIWEMDLDAAKSGNGAWGGDEVVNEKNINLGNKDVTEAPLTGNYLSDAPEVLSY